MSDRDGWVPEEIRFHLQQVQHVGPPWTSLLEVGPPILHARRSLLGGTGEMTVDVPLTSAETAELDAVLAKVLARLRE